MFDEVFDDRELFLEAFLKELVKKDKVKKSTGRQPMRLNRVISNTLIESIQQF